MMPTDFHNLMDLDYLETSQLAFKINEKPFTVSSYLNWVSNKPQSNLCIDDQSSVGSTASLLRNVNKQSSHSNLRHSDVSSYFSTAENEGDQSFVDATEQLLLNEVDPKSKPPPLRCSSNLSHDNGNWAAFTSVSGHDRKTWTSAVYISNKNSARNTMTQSFHNNHTSQEEEMDGPEIARLMRWFWPRDINFFGFSSGRSSATETSRKSLHESTSSKSSRFDHRSTSISFSQGARRPSKLNLKSASMTEPLSFDPNFESSLELDWDHEPGFCTKAAAITETEAKRNQWSINPIDDALLDKNPKKIKESVSTMPAFTSKTIPILALSNRNSSNHLQEHKAKSLHNQSALMVDSGFVGYETTTDQSNSSILSPNACNECDILWERSKPVQNQLTCLQGK